MNSSSGIATECLATIERMSHNIPTTLCLTHQLPEESASPVGLVCPECKQRLYLEPPAGRCRSFWESQPAAYALDGRPCFVYTLVWDDFRIRSLHRAESQSDPRSQNQRLSTTNDA